MTAPHATPQRAPTWLAILALLLAGRRGDGDDQAQALALGLEQFGVGAAGARGQPPVDVAGVVAVGVFARLGVLHAAPAQRRQRLPADAVAALARAAAAGDGGAQRHQFGQAGNHALAHRLLSLQSLGKRDTPACASAPAANTDAADRETAIAKRRFRNRDVEARPANAIPTRGLKATAPS